MNEAMADTLWVVLCAILVFNMQLGFLCLESGLTRSKNAINVALKNVTDFTVAVLLYWLFGFGLMFGASHAGWIGIDQFLPEVGGGAAWLAAFFLFQAMFCATAATILSGAAAERLRFGSYLVLASLVAGLIYPVFGHWAWGGALVVGTPGVAGGQGGQGWLAADGFIDFAGATVVHGVGGWVSLAVLLVIGAREGRFATGERPRPMPASNLPLAMLGALLLLFGWFGFNGGSTLALDQRVAGILVNTLLGGVTGFATVLAVNWRLKGYTDAVQPMNGLLAGLVAVTAGAHVISALDAIVIGAVGGLVMLGAQQLLLRWRIDDAVGAVPVHLAAGIWGTLAVALFGDLTAMGTGLSRGAQLVVQAEGIAVCAAWSFGVAFLLVTLINRRFPLRVDPEAERRGLNVSEHGARTELIELLDAMEGHARDGAIRQEVPVEPFTEVGQIASQYNKVICALGQAVHKTQAILRDIRDGIITFNGDGVLTSLNPGAERLFGLPAEASGVTLPRLLAEQEWQPQLLPSPGGEVKREVKCRRWDGSAFLAEITISRDMAGVLYTGMLRDITERRRIEAQLLHEKTLAQITLAAIRDGVITTDHGGRVQYLNPVAEQLTGYTTAEATGRPVGEIYRVVDERSAAVLPNPLLQVLRAPGLRPAASDEQHRVLLRRDGQGFPVHDAASPIRSAEDELIGAVLTFRDVTATRQLARELSHQAAHDALTGLINRAEFERRLNHLLQTCGDKHHPGVLCYLDLDQFKVVNDTCGHVAGDELLRQLAALFRSRIRGSDVLARLGGDEFGVLLCDCDIDHALQIAESIRKLTEEFRFSWQRRTFAVGVSIGLVAIDGSSESFADLMRAADAACYAAKDAGRNRWHVYQADDQGLLKREGEMLWVNRIRRALDEDRLRLFVQPIVPLNAASEEGPRYEVLLRMLDHNGEVIPPGAFMPAAERYNVATAIDRWVVANTLAWIGDYVRQRGTVPGHYSINLSADSLGEKSFLDFVLDRMAHNRVPPESICFEVTETSAIANLSSAITFITRLKGIGCKFALDDFGSGVSSFGYLKNLPVDYLKIDGVFVKDICKDPIARAMVASIHNIGQEMGLRTVAEFVESAEIVDELRLIGVTFAQGFYLGKPVPLGELSEVRMMPR